MVDDARDFYLLGESVPEVRVSARTLALRGFFIEYIYIYIYIYIKQQSVNDRVGSVTWLLNPNFSSPPLVSFSLPRRKKNAFHLILLRTLSTISISLFVNASLDGKGMFFNEYSRLARFGGSIPADGIPGRVLDTREPYTTKVIQSRLPAESARHGVEQSKTTVGK